MKKYIPLLTALALAACVMGTPQVDDWGTVRSVQYLNASNGPMAASNGATAVTTTTRTFLLYGSVSVPTGARAVYERSQSGCVSGSGVRFNGGPKYMLD